MPRGCPQASWLRQVESHLKDSGMAGPASALAMARRRPKDSTVARWTRRRPAPAYAPVPHLTWCLSATTTCLYVVFAILQIDGKKMEAHFFYN